VRHEMQRFRLAMRDGLAGEIGLTAAGRVGRLLGFVWAAGCGSCGPDEERPEERRADHSRVPPLRPAAGGFRFRMTWIRSPLVIIVATQLLFTAGDLLARANLRHNPFSASTFLSWWFVLYFLIRQVAMFGQLYVFSALQIGKTMALFSATSIVVVNVLGVLLLGEVLSVQAYLAIGLVVLGFVLMSVSP